MTGKGGVGKTTVAYALGLAAAARGKRAIVCEVGSRERGSTIFGREPIAFDEASLSDGLWGIAIDFDEAGREYLERQMPVRSMGTLLSKSNLFSYLAAATPGLGEMVTMGKIWELAMGEREEKLGKAAYDVVIVDAPATGHGIAMLQTPRNFREIARTGPLAKQAGRIEETIADSAVTGVVVVARAEEMAVNEAIMLERALAGPEAGTRLALDRFYANALIPPRFTSTELESLRALLAAEGADPGAADPALAAAIGEAARARTQSSEVDRLRDSVAAPICELPLLPAAQIGLDEVMALAGDLA